MNYNKSAVNQGVKIRKSFSIDPHQKKKKEANCIKVCPYQNDQHETKRYDSGDVWADSEI